RLRPFRTTGNLLRPQSQALGRRRNLRTATVPPAAFQTHAGDTRARGTTVLERLPDDDKRAWAAVLKGLRLARGLNRRSAEEWGDKRVWYSIRFARGWLLPCKSAEPASGNRAVLLSGQPYLLRSNFSRELTGGSHPGRARSIPHP